MWGLPHVVSHVRSNIARSLHGLISPIIGWVSDEVDTTSPLSKVQELLSLSVPTCLVGGIIPSVMDIQYNADVVIAANTLHAGLCVFSQYLIQRSTLPSLSPTDSSRSLFLDAVVISDEAASDTLESKEDGKLDAKGKKWKEKEKKKSRNLRGENREEKSEEELEGKAAAHALSLSISPQDWPILDSSRSHPSSGRGGVRWTREEIRRNEEGFKRATETCFVSKKRIKVYYWVRVRGTLPPLLSSVLTCVRNDAGYWFVRVSISLSLHVVSSRTGVLIRGFTPRPFSSILEGVFFDPDSVQSYVALFPSTKGVSPLLLPSSLSYTHHLLSLSHTYMKYGLYNDALLTVLRACLLDSDSKALAEVFLDVVAAFHLPSGLLHRHTSMLEECRPLVEGGEREREREKEKDASPIGSITQWVLDDALSFHHVEHLTLSHTRRTYFYFYFSAFFFFLPRPLSNFMYSVSPFLISLYFSSLSLSLSLSRPYVSLPSLSLIHSTAYLTNSL